MKDESLKDKSLSRAAAESSPMTEAPLLLSLCIPTYQRVGFLEEGLDAVLKQWAGDLTPLQRNQVEIVVCDNASADGTPALIARVQAAHPELRLIYFRQPENRGADANILHSLSLGTGEYLYILSDDDILLAGAIRAMLALMDAQPDVAAFCLNSRPFVTDPAEERLPVLPADRDRLIASRDDCLRLLGTRLTFLSLLLFRREGFAAAEYEKFVGTNLLQSYIFVDVLGRGRMYLTRRVFLATRDNNSGGYNFFQVFVSGFGDLMRYARVQGCGEAAVRSVLLRHLSGFLAPYVAEFKLQGVVGGLQPNYRDGIRRLLAEYGLHPFLVFGLLPLMLAPSRAVYALRAGVRFARRCTGGKRTKR